MPTLELLQEAERQLTICNACRYCEGYCAVWPAMERRSIFKEADLLYLANLCHDCRDCLYACQYAPPHAFAVNPPRVFAELRTETYRDYAAPRLLSQVLSRTWLPVCISVLAILRRIVLTATALAASPGLLWLSAGLRLDHPGRNHRPRLWRTRALSAVPPGGRARNRRRCGARPGLRWSVVAEMAERSGPSGRTHAANGCGIPDHVAADRGDGPAAAGLARHRRDGRAAGGPPRRGGRAFSDNAIRQVRTYGLSLRGAGAQCDRIDISSRTRRDCRYSPRGSLRN